MRADLGTYHARHAACCDDPAQGSFEPHAPKRLLRPEGMKTLSRPIGRHPEITAAQTPRVDCRVSG